MHGIEVIIDTLKNQTSLERHALITADSEPQSANRGCAQNTHSGSPHAFSSTMATRPGPQRRTYNQAVIARRATAGGEGRSPGQVGQAFSGAAPAGQEL
jgi:hypothetical protein